MSMTDEERGAIRARLAGATAMPWEQGEPNGCTIWSQHGVYICETVHRADAALIANAPADIAKLLDEVERLRAEQEPPEVQAVIAAVTWFLTTKSYAEQHGRAGPAMDAAMNAYRNARRRQGRWEE